MSGHLDIGGQVPELIRSLGRILDLQSTSHIGTGVLYLLVLVESNVDVGRL